MMIYSRPFFIFLVVYLLMFFFAIAPVYQSDITNELRDNINSYGILFHFLSIISFLIGTHAASFSYKYSSIQEKFFVFRKKRFSILIYSYCFIGLFVVLWQISISISPRDYFNELISYIALQQEMPAIRAYFLLDRESGGLPGIIKMFSYLPLSALYMVLTYEFLNKRMYSQKSDILSPQTKKYLFIIFIVILARSAVTLDRAVLISFFLLLLYYFIFSSNNLKRLILNLLKRPVLHFSAITIFISLYGITIIRQGKGLGKALAEYSSLGLANLSILFEKAFDYTWGTESVFHVIYFPLNYFELTHILPVFREADWIWNPARYLTAYVYQDFGIFSIIFFILFGFLATFIYLKAFYKSNPYTIVTLFPLIIVIAGSVGVPAFRGADWWVSLLMGIVGIKLCFKHSTKFYQK